MTANPPSALESMMTPDERTAAEADAARWRYGFFIVLAGLVVVLVGFTVSVLNSGEVATMFAGVCGVVGTIIGAYFGVQAGQAGKDRAEAELRRVNDMAIRMAAYIDRAQIDQALGPRRDRRPAVTYPPAPAPTTNPHVDPDVDPASR
ncbi:hypothetical protein AB0K60_02455 [Thermopolyspora sp. NPDC052614]|uniref:hypothetical protein n=1 Tax=Thermopolyspora sp. NPDC052614 TaxID=3155682 RepID=UPI0034414BD1